MREFISHDAYLDVSRCLCHGMRWLLLAPQFPAPCPNPIAWVKIGASFLNKDGSESVLLDALPVNGTLQLRTPKATDALEGQTA